MSHSIYVHKLTVKFQTTRFLRLKDYVGVSRFQLGSRTPSLCRVTPFWFLKLIRMAFRVLKKYFSLIGPRWEFY